MTNHEQPQRYVFGTYHSEYISMGMGLPPLNPTTRRGSISVSIAFEPMAIHDFEAHYEEIASIIELLLGPDLGRLVERFSYSELEYLTYVVIHATSDQLQQYLKSSVVWLLDRILWLDCEDDHCEFFPSTYDYLTQIADVIDGRDELEPLLRAFETRSTAGCDFCVTEARRNDVPYRGCYLP